MTLTVPEDMHAVLMRRVPGVAASQLQLRVAEFLKFLQLAACMNARHLPISAEIDEVWHAFILETRVYAALCEQAGGFVHHTAKEADPGSTTLRQLDDDLAFVVAYLEHFGEFPKAALPLWPALNRLSAHLGVSIDELGHFARALGQEKAGLLVANAPSRGRG